MHLQLIKKTGPVVFAILCLMGCGNRYDVVAEQVITVANSKRLDDTVMRDSTDHILFSRLRRPATFSFKYEYQIPEEKRDSEFYIVVSGRSRTNYAQSNAVMAVVPSENGEQVEWMIIPMRYQYTDINTWCHFRDSIRLPKHFNGKGYNRVTVAAHLSSSTAENFDLDTLHVMIRQKR